MGKSRDQTCSPEKNWCQAEGWTEWRVDQDLLKFIFIDEARNGFLGFCNKLLNWSSCSIFASCNIITTQQPEPFFKTTTTKTGHAISLLNSCNWFFKSFRVKSLWWTVYKFVSPACPPSLLFPRLSPFQPRNLFADPHTYWTYSHLRTFAPTNAGLSSPLLLNLGSSVIFLLRTFLVTLFKIANICLHLPITAFCILLHLCVPKHLSFSNIYIYYILYVYVVYLWFILLCLLFFSLARI